ncbi:hypothetical protein [Cedecea colo]|uniref:Inner membrane protein n=1 Tax=Cedecea colo TaxID=2552946 RepID=A0ABX0VLH6_9ENTR|nr:hypothetical protein [Cedecea colo]NIY47848.1 hypothetical protein [Cedecea colo]
MTRHYPLFSMLCFGLALIAALAGYFLWQRFYAREFSCHATLVQHHPNETLNLWLNYSVSGGRGMLSMNGHVQNDPSKKINRKIFFSVRKHNSIYHFHSQKNIRFPDDNVNDSWLEKYEPDFFVYPDKSIYIRIGEQQKGNYHFTFATLPAYVCSR